nr:Chain S, KGISSQY [synthetic construct]
KGISSQY